MITATVAMAATAGLFVLFGASRLAGRASSERECGGCSGCARECGNHADGDHPVGRDHPIERNHHAARSHHAAGSHDAARNHNAAGRHHAAREHRVEWSRHVERSSS